MIDERDVRDMLERRAEAISATPTDEPEAIRRARGRLTRNATVAGLAGLVLIVGGLAGLRMIQATPSRVMPAEPRPLSGEAGSLAYVLDGDVYIAEWDGANAVRIADAPSNCGYWTEGPMWSPDGRYLAYRQSCSGPEKATGGGVIISGPAGNVVAEFPGSGFSGAPSGRLAWSPDATRLATWVEYGETIGVFGIDGTRHALLRVPPLETGPVDPRWLPDGRSLVVSDVVVPIDGSTPYRLPPGDPRGGWYSPDGSRVAYLKGGADNSLVVARADGSDPEVVFDGRVVLGPDLVWSPAGDRIAFTSNRAGSDTISGFELRVVDLTTGAVTLLAEASTDVLLSALAFSPDGERILFERPQGIGSIWSVDVDGSDPRRLVSRAFSGDWQPPRPRP